jgi:hypothetical protein
MGGCILFQDGLVQYLDASVKLEQTIELRHEVFGDGSAGRSQNQTGGSYASAGGSSRLRAVVGLPGLVRVFHGCGLCRVRGGHGVGR